LSEHVTIGAATLFEEFRRVMPRRTSPHLISARFLPNTPAGFDSYPFDIPAVRDLERIAFHPNVTFFVGENGAGKSTVLEALAMALGFSAEGGTRNARVETVTSVSSLHETLRLARGVPFPKDGYFLRAESFFNVATYMDAVGGLDASLHRQSHGEAFMQILLEKMRGQGLYLLDEPEAALSPSRQLAALRAIHELVEDGSQFIIATHSPILLAYPDARIVLFDASGVSEIAYEDTEHFAITKDFLNHHAHRVRRLLEDDR
jgi:predicted ATPase